MNENELQNLIDSQRVFFNNNSTKPISFRLKMLQKLREAILKNEALITEAVYNDLSKPASEAYLTEISTSLHEVDIALSNLKAWAKRKRARSTISSFLSSSKIYYEPYGVALILSPWNYPFNLTFSPLVGAIAAGNCAIVKCSPTSPHSSKLIRNIINSTFEKEYIYCLDETIAYDTVNSMRYDFIFFTGSTRVAKIIMANASRHLTPICLELGGKSPCIIDKSANLKLAAKRIIWGKIINAGQTCIAPDYILADITIKDKLIECLKKELYEEYPLIEEDISYPKIINAFHFERLKKLLEGEEDYIGGRINETSMKISPAILHSATFESKAMQEEIFGPILPVISYDNISTIISELKRREKPLACYIFTEEKKFAERIIGELEFGGGCINDVIMHVTNSNIPFGGVGFSGLGSYHGRFSFETFSHKKSILSTPTALDIPFRYNKFSKKYLSFLKKLI